MLVAQKNTAIKAMKRMCSQKGVKHYTEANRKAVEQIIEKQRKAA